MCGPVPLTDLASEINFIPSPSYDLLLTIFIPTSGLYQDFYKHTTSVESWFYSSNDWIRPKHTKMITEFMYLFTGISDDLSY